MKKQSDLTHGNLWKQIFLFSLPLILSNILQVLFNISDVAVIGRFAGATSLGGVGSSSTLVTLFMGFLLGFGSAVNVVVARHLGEKNEEKLGKAIQTGFFLCLLMGLLIGALGLFLCKPILLLMNTKEAFLEKAVLYSRVYFLGMPGCALYNYCNGTFSANGNTKTPLICLSAAGVLNIGLNLLFVIVFRMDVLGVALASALTTTLSGMLCLFFLAKEKSLIRFRFHFAGLDAREAREIFAMGISTGFQNSLFAISNLFIQSGVNFLSETTVEGCAAAQNADAFVWDSMAAFYMASSSFLGQNYGAGDRKRCIQAFGITTLDSCLLGVLMGGILILLSTPFLSLFATEEAVIEAGKQRLILMCCSYAFSAFQDNPIAASRGLGKTLVPTIAVILGSVVFRIAWVYLVFPRFQTVHSLFLLYFFSWNLTGIFETSYFFALYRKRFPKKAKASN